MKARVAWAKARGVAEYARFLNELSTPTRLIVEEGVMQGEWYPYETFLELCEVLDRLFGAGDLELCVDIGRYTCNANLTSLYRFLFRVGNVHFIIRRAAAAWRLNYDEGQMRVVSVGPESAVLQISGWPEPHRAHCLSVKGWVLEAGRLSGKPQIREVHEKCRAKGDEVCELAVEWS